MNSYDVIVVGARCAGSPTAMLLARKGYRVLLLDRATFPSDTVSTHVLHPPTVAALRRWGLLERLLATGCPPVTTYSFDFGPFTISGAPGTDPEPAAYCPRRTVLDKLLVDAAAEAGVEVREGFAVTEVLLEDGTVTGVRGRAAGDHDAPVVTERARVVVGADGLRSSVARAVGAQRYHERPPLLAAYYSYWSDLPSAGVFPTWIRGDYGWATAPTHDGLTLVVGGWPYEKLEAHRDDVEGTFRRHAFAAAPEFEELIAGATRRSPWVGMATPNFFRTPYGPGWVLVGDAGYVKDPITAQGIKDAFRDAEACATALDSALSGARPFGEVMGDYRATRDRDALPMYGFTCEVASPGPPPAEQVALLAAVAADPEASADFVHMWAGVMPAAEFFAPGNIGRIMAGAPA